MARPAIDYAGVGRTDQRAERGLEISTLLWRLDWVLLGATAAAVAYGLWAIGGITNKDVPYDPHYYLVRQASYAAIGGVAGFGATGSHDPFSFALVVHSISSAHTHRCVRPRMRPSLGAGSRSVPLGSSAAAIAGMSAGPVGHGWAGVASAGQPPAALPEPGAPPAKRRQRR